MSHNILWGIPAAIIDFHLSNQTRKLFFKKNFLYLNAETTDKIAKRVECSLLTTYQTSGYSLGTASRSYHYVEQANNFLLHYRRLEDQPGIVYTRLRIGNSRCGSFRHSLLQSSKSNDNNRGTLYSVQRESRVVGLYTVHELFESESISLDLVWPNRSELDEVWVGEYRISSLPVELGIDETVYIRDGAILLGVRMLPYETGSSETSALGILHTEGGYLYLSFYCYKGVSRRFKYTDIANGLIVEVANSSLQGGLNAFMRHCSGWHVINTVRNGRIRELGVTCGHGSVEMRYDLVMERIIDRYVDGKPLVLTMFESPTARQGRGSLIQVGRARLVAGKDVSALLMADEKTSSFTVVNPELWATAITLETPNATIYSKSFAFGSNDIRFIPGEGGATLEVCIETLYNLEPIEISTKASHVKVQLNGKDLSLEVERRRSGLFVLPVVAHTKKLEENLV